MYQTKNSCATIEDYGPFEAIEDLGLRRDLYMGSQLYDLSPKMFKNLLKIYKLSPSQRRVAMRSFEGFKSA